MSKLSPATLLLGIVAILFGLAGAWYVQKLRQPTDEVAANAPRADLVPVASTKLKAGRQITLGDIAILRMTVEQRRQAGLNAAYMISTNQIIGRILKEDLEAGQTFETKLFYPEGVVPSPADRLKPGFRAVTVTIEGSSAVAGFATPGAFVDVLFRSEEKTSEDLPEMTMTLVEGVEVLALDAQTFEGSRVDTTTMTRKLAVTVAVTPQQAATLRVADGRGLMSLALRNPDDLGPSASENSPRTLDDVLDRPTSKWRMEVYRGNALSKVDFKRDGRETPTGDFLADGKRVAAAPASTGSTAGSKPSPSLVPPSDSPSTPGGK